VAVLKAPRELLSGDYDIKFLNFRNFGKPDEIAKIGIGSQTTSAGLVPGWKGREETTQYSILGELLASQMKRLASNAGRILNRAHFGSGGLPQPWYRHERVADFL